MTTKLLQLLLFPIIFGFFVTSYTQTLPDPNNGLFYIATKSNGQIDSSFSEWENQVPIYLNQTNQAKYTHDDWKGPSDCSARIWMGWSDEGFIIAAEVMDNHISFPFSGFDVWSNDCIQFALDIQDDNDPNYYQSDDREFVISMVDSQAIVFEHSYTENRNSGYRDYPVQIVVTGNTIRYEALIPWSGLGLIGPFAGMHIGASVVVFDNDRGSYRGWLEWTVGITRKKFTLPFANVLLFDPNVNIVQAIPTQPFISENDSLFLWAYTRYYRKRVTYRLFENDEIFFRNNIRMQARKWIKLTIPAKAIKWGRLTLELNSTRITQLFDISIWSKQLILEQIGYLTQQVQVFKNLKNIDPAASFIVEYWVELLQNKFSTAKTNFDFYDVMNQAQKRIDQIPNFYMKKQVYFNREHRIVETLYKSDKEQKVRRYLLHLPSDFTREKRYPVLVFIHDVRNNEEESARKIGNLLAKFDLPIIGVFPKTYPDLGMTFFGLEETMACLADVAKKYQIENNRIYMVGEGSAGLEVLLLAQNHPDKFAAVTTMYSKIDTNIRVENLTHIPLNLLFEDKYIEKNILFKNKIENLGGNITLTNLSEKTGDDETEFFSMDFFKWLLNQKRTIKPPKIRFRADQLKPSKVFWIKVLSQKNYELASLVEAVLDSNRIFVSTQNLSKLSIVTSELPDFVKYPIQITIDINNQFNVKENINADLVFQKVARKWKMLKKTVEELEKLPAVCGPMATIFDKPIKFVYSTIHEDNNYNQLCYELTKKSSQRSRTDYLNHLLIPDTVFAKQKVNSNIITFGNAESNAYLRKINSKLPMQTYQGGVKFGRSVSDLSGSAAFYIYPNPENPNYLIFIGLAPDTAGLKNIQTMWDLNYSNIIYRYDYAIMGGDVKKNQYQNWIDFGFFDNYWSVPWFSPHFKKGPKYWHTDIAVGMDANQLSLNNNWKGGGKGNFTWKIYTKMEYKYLREKYNWKNSFYCAFGQISVQEDENWRAPEKSTDIIDFDSVLKLTLKKFIDPYIAISLDTQFHEGYNPKTKKLVSRFANPLRLSQSAGLARSLSKKKSFQLSTRVGYAAKEVIASKKSLRKLWTGDETKWRKIDGGFEWLTEIKSDFAKGIVLTNKLKVFQALFSSISPQKDPKKNWKKTDVYWEQMFNAKLTQYIVFNVIVKFIYDKDTSKGGQFLENASLGLSYKF
jgi:hypothetical protein